METTIDEAVLSINENHGYIAVIMGDSSIDTHLVAERRILASTSNPITLLSSLLALYFTFNIAYPKPLYPTCIFLQRIVFKIVDTQNMPDIVKRIVTSLDNIIQV